MKIGCPKCGSNVSFKPETQNFYCEHCGQHSDIGEFSVDLENINDNYDECTCSSCGAKLIVGKNTTITVCVYCGSNQIITNRFTGEFLPDGIIPFKVSKEEFIRRYRDFIRRKLFVPRKFKENMNIAEVKGLYVPFQNITYDCDIDARGKMASGFQFDRKSKMLLDALLDAGKNFDDDITSSLEPFYLQMRIIKVIGHLFYYVRHVIKRAVKFAVHS